MDLNERFSYQFSKNEEKLNDAAESNNSKMCAFRQQMLALHQLGRETSEKTSCDLLQDNLDKMLNDKFSKQYIQNRANNIKKILGNRRVVRISELNEVDDAQLEPGCHGVYESCKNSEITAKDFDNFKKCLANNDKIAKNICTSSSLNSMDSKSFMQTNYHQQQDTSLNSAIKANEQKIKNPTVSIENNSLNSFSFFRTAREELLIQKANKTSPSQKTTAALFNNSHNNAGTTKKRLGGRRTVLSAFVPPIRPASPKAEESQVPSANVRHKLEDERLLNIDPKMIELIENEIMHKFKPIEWSDIAGLDYAKSIIKEAVVYPILRPDIFTGLRRPPRGILLFGPPGTGKTLIGKCIASQSNATFFSISASSLTSKWIGESEKMVRALFAVATVKQPSVVFIDEIDSLLSQRSDTEHESSRRLKTEFLVQLDGAATSDEDRVVIVGATNRPQELDEAARRRLVRRLYIPLPELEARIKMLCDLLQKDNNSLNQTDINRLGQLTEGYSGADIKSLCHESSMEPIRSIPADQISFFKVAEVRPISMQDFISALERVRPSVSQLDLKQYTDWNEIYGAAR